MKSLSKKTASDRLFGAEENIPPLMVHGWHSGILLELHLNAVPVIPCYTLTRIILLSYPTYFLQSGSYTSPYMHLCKCLTSSRRNSPFVLLVPVIMVCLSQ